MSRITDKIFLGSLDDALNPNFIKNNNIKLIISILEEHVQPFYSDVKQLSFKIDDHPYENILPICNTVYGTIINNKGPILIHCRLGVSRSATNVIFYLMRRFNLTYDQAIAYVREKRPIVNPNMGFQKQLRGVSKLNTW